MKIYNCEGFFCYVTIILLCTRATISGIQLYFFRNVVYTFTYAYKFIKVFLLFLGLLALKPLKKVL